MFTSGFFNSVNSDRKYNAEQMSAIFDGIIRDGIFDSVGDHFAVTPGTGLAVSVGTGRAWLNSTWSYNDTAYPIALSAASASLSRIDLICIKVDKSSNVRTNSIVCIEGTPASSPVEPTITDDATNEIYYHKLAAVSVAAGATSISAADITNYVGLAAGTPYVTGILSSTTVDELWSQWDGEFNDWWDDIKATLDDNIVTTILNKIDHITPKESTMNLYGFSHINPPPAGKTYQEYSTDAILNQISSLLSTGLGTKVDVITDMIVRGSSDSAIKTAAEFLTGKTVLTTYYENLNLPYTRNLYPNPPPYERITIPLPCQKEDIIKIAISMGVSLTYGSEGTYSHTGGVTLTISDAGVVTQNSTYLYSQYPFTWHNANSANSQGNEFVIRDYNVFDATVWYSIADRYRLVDHYFKATYYYLANN